jgi:hypothetical protein
MVRSRGRCVRIEVLGDLLYLIEVLDSSRLYAADRTYFLTTVASEELLPDPWLYTCHRPPMPINRYRLSID